MGIKLNIFGILNRSAILTFQKEFITDILIQNRENKMSIKLMSLLKCVNIIDQSNQILILACEVYLNYYLREITA